MKWENYEELFRRDQLVSGELRVCPKLTVAHIQPYQSDKIRVKLATQVFSNSMAGGFQYYQKYGVPELTACDGTINFTIYTNNLFDALNRRFSAQGLKPGCDDLVIIQNAIVWLDD